MKINAVKIAHLVVAKAVETVAAADPVSGEIIVTNFVLTTVHHQAVYDQLDSAAVARPGIGDESATTLVA